MTPFDNPANDIKIINQNKINEDRRKLKYKVRNFLCTIHKTIIEIHSTTCIINFVSIKKCLDITKKIMFIMLKTIPVIINFDFFEFFIKPLLIVILHIFRNNTTKALIFILKIFFINTSFDKMCY